MGSIITLSIGKLEVDWGKNFFHISHSPLFVKGDLKELDRECFDSYSDEVIIEKHKVLSAPLKNILPSLELLGYTIDSVKKIYYQPVEDGYIAKKDIVEFDVFLSAISRLNVNNSSISYQNDDYDPGEFTRKEIMPLLKLLPEDKDIFSFPSNYNMGEFLENFDPWAILRLLAENKDNLELAVVWDINDIVENEYLTIEKATSSLPAENKFIIVTEGSSDTYIIKHAFEILRPNISDFFLFIDMEENYPFTGVGNLHNFCKGLAKVGILNKILFIYDADTEGYSKFKEVDNLDLPDNMEVMLLPNLENFEKFNTVGPSGESIENIHRKAVSIECFLDLNYDTDKKPSIRWTSYNHKLNSYQGELEEKTTFTKKFMGIKTNDSQYDVTKNKTNGWNIKKVGADKASKVVETQKEAEKLAKQFAGNSGGGEVRIHGRDGLIRDSDTVPPGNDPNPPEDKKH